jgi:hypothetical protein
MKTHKTIFFLCIILFGCEQAWVEVLKKTDIKTRYGNNLRDWELTSVNETEWERDFILRKVDNDTLKILCFLEGKRDGSISIYEYKKRYPCGIDTCYLEMAGMDTSFFYRQRNSVKEFEVGEYAYRYMYFKMDTSEANAYRLAEDSLRRVRGNGLPRIVE